MQVNWRFVRRWLRLLIFAAVVAVLFLPLALGGLMMFAITHPPCNHSGGTPEDRGLAFEDIRFTNQHGHEFAGFFLPGAAEMNGATVIIAPTLPNGRGSHLNKAELLNRAGFNVLTFDSRRCIGLPHSLGYAEAEDVTAAYEYLSARDDVDPNRVSAHGFSSAGATSLFAAAQIPELRGVSAEGGYHDFSEQLGLGYDGTPIEHLIRFGAASTYRLITGNDIGVLKPIDAAVEMTPRPIMLIYGSGEVSLPGARATLEAVNSGGGNAELWVVEGAGHGNYHVIAGEEYARRLVEFHSMVLLGE